MTLLLYNWIPSNSRHRVGGGIQVYQTNLVRHLLAGGIQVIELSSGFQYGLIRRGYRILKTEAADYTGLQVINSPVPAPSHSGFDNPGGIEHAEFEAFLMQTLESLGPIDVFHFNSLEGIPAGFISRIRKHYPESRIFYSFHNYHPFCPQVNFWHRERERCDDDFQGRRCIHCIDRTQVETLGQRRMSKLLGRGNAWKVMRKVSTMVSRMMILRNRPDTPSASRAVGPPTVPPATAEFFRNRKSAIIGILNGNIDQFLCVSERTAEIARSHGIEPERIFVDYIGIDFPAGTAQGYQRHPHHPDFPGSRDGTLSLGYFGYIRPDKGFDWFMDWIESLDETYRDKLSFVISSRTGDHNAMQRIHALSDRFRVNYYPGYSHQTMERQLASVDVGIVPPLWEDCLPQVAKEFLHYSIPIVSSNRGGARELIGDEDYVFDPDAPETLTRIVDRLLDTDGVPEDYWRNCRQTEDFSSYIIRYLDLIG